MEHLNPFHARRAWNEYAISLREIDDGFAEKDVKGSSGNPALRPDHNARPPEAVLDGSYAVSIAVSLLRHSVDLRVRCYDTDAQDLA